MLYILNSRGCWPSWCSIHSSRLWCSPPSNAPLLSISASVPSVRIKPRPGHWCYSILFSLDGHRRDCARLRKREREFNLRGYIPVSSFDCYYISPSVSPQSFLYNIHMGIYLWREVFFDHHVRAVITIYTECEPFNSWRWLLLLLLQLNTKKGAAFFSGR
jgi:hypothetical protein